MAKVSLRVYNREIEGLIEGSQLDEAIAHCQHILKTFPMYIETYRLLGKTFLEARKYGDAADIFLRALMAVPDDFVSHVGMSIIRDDEGKLDEAIWHMERAFEIQPSNAAIQSELRRLYGRRDGVEPPKIRLSRDALANMYSQGELFNQAIAEIRAVLADDPNRPDLQVMLARSYYRAGQKVEAAEMAAILLKKFPYCLDALRILVDVLPGTSQTENTQIYRHRLGMLDPYSLFAKDSSFASDQVGDSAVSIERLDYRPGAAPASTEPDWASSLGIQLEGEKKVEGTPAWLQPASQGAEPPLESVLPANSAQAGQNESVPEWMRSAGWTPSSGDQEETPPADFEAETPAEPAAQADIPDWVKSMAPAGIMDNNNPPVEAGNAATPPAEEGDIPDWLKAMKPAGLESEANEPTPLTAEPAPAPAAGEEEEGIPDWLKSLAPADAVGGGNGGSQPAASMAESEAPEEPSMPAAKADIPDWLKASAPADVEPQVEPQPPMELLAAETPAGILTEAEMPDWLKASEPTLPAAQEESQEAAPASELTMPDWLKSAAPETKAEEPVPPAKMEVPAALPESEPMAADIPDWLKSMAPPEPVELEPVDSNAPSAEPPAPVIPPEPSAQIEVPDWLKPITSTAPADSAAGLEAMPPADLPDFSAPAQPNADADFPDWLKTLGPAPEVPSELPETAAPIEMPAMDAQPDAAGAGPLPDWLSSLESNEEKAAELADTQPTPAVSLSRKAEAEPVEPVILPDWLTGMAEKEPPAEEPSVSMASEAAQPVPPEMTPMEAPADSTTAKRPDEDEAFVPTGEAKPLTIDDNALGWLERLAAQQGAKADELLTTPEDRDKVIMPESWLSDSMVSPEKPVEPPVEKAPPPEEIRAPLETLPLPSLDAYIKKDAQRQPMETLPLSPLQIFGQEKPAEPEPPKAEPPVEDILVQPEEAAPAAPAAEEAPAQPVNIEDNMMAWLEGLAAKQGARPEELLTKPEDRPESAPEWVQQVSAEQPAVPAEPLPMSQPEAAAPMEPIAPIVTEEAAPVEPPAQVVPEAVAPEVTPPPAEVEKPASVNDRLDEDITITTWLSHLEPEEAGTQPAPEAAPIEADAAPEEELPDWLRDMEKPVEPVTPVEPVVPAEAEGDLPAWLQTPVEPPAEMKTESAPVLETPAIPEAEEPMPDWMREPEKTTGGTAPTEPDEWVPMEEAAQKSVESEDEAVPELEQEFTPVNEPAAVEETPAGSDVHLAPIPIHDKDSACLGAAQAALENNALETAVKEYSKLVKKGRLLDEVIHDLKEATYRFPVDAILWQALGDAYMRANRLQDALDSYTKAEELLR